MCLLPNQRNFELIFQVWLHSQIRQLSAKALSKGMFVQLTHFDFHDIEYLLKHKGITMHCSPAEAYALLQFCLALEELNKKDQMTRLNQHSC